MPQVLGSIGHLLCIIALLQIRTGRLHPPLEVTRSPCLRLTDTLRLLPAPVRCGGVTAGEHLGTFQPVAGETAEVDFSSSVQVRHRHFSSGRLAGKRTAQHKGWRTRQTRSMKHSPASDNLGPVRYVFICKKCLIWMNNE